MVQNEAVLFEERRKEVRFTLSGLIPLELRNMANNDFVATVFLDISTRGLGVLIEPGFQIDEIVNLKVNERLKIPMSVRWIKKPTGVLAPGVPALNRAGLCLVQNDGPMETHDLLELLSPLHCIEY